MTDPSSTPPLPPPSAPPSPPPAGGADAPDVPPPPGSGAPATPAESDLWVFALTPPVRAQEALLAAGRLAARGALDLEDAAIVTNRRGRVRITQTRDINPSQGAIGGAWLGTIAGLFAGLPLVGAAIGAAAGGLVGKLRDYGIDDDAMRALGRELGDDEGALFLLVRDCHRVRALHEVSRFPGRLVRSTAAPDVVELVQARLAVDPWDG
ncbi:MAG: hypothetical protein RLZZ272_1707 [Actinomycetota bacterium]